MKTIIISALFAAMAAILIAATTPNFIDAQVRQRMARAYADLPVLAAACEAYRIDHGKYPFDGYGTGSGVPGYQYWALPFHITTPVAYLGEIPIDPFREDKDPTLINGYRYSNTRSTWGTDYFRTTPSIYFDATMEYWGEFRFVCVGPDETYGPTSGSWYNPPINYPSFNIPYDPTNGLVSSGDIERSQKKAPYLP